MSDAHELEALSELADREKPVQTKTPRHFKLGEEVAPGVHWWGKVRTEHKHLKASFICTCGEEFREQVASVLIAKITCCPKCRRR